MNRLPIERQAQVVSLLVEGMSMRAIVRATGVSMGTVAKLLTDMGIAAAVYQDRVLRDLPGKHIECDEIWGSTRWSGDQPTRAAQRPGVPRA